MAWDARVLCGETTAGPVRVPVVFAVAGDAELELDLALTPSATVADLVEALAGGGPVGPSTVLSVDGRPADLDAPVAEVGLRPGSRLALDVWEAPMRNGALALPKPVVEVRVVGGLDAGPSYPLAVGRWVVGREGDVVLAGATVSARHVELEVDALGRVAATDLGSHNGTRVDGEFVASRVVDAGSLIELGAVQLRVVPAAVGPQERPRSMNRPPRPARPAPPTPIAVPEEPAPPTARSRLAWIAMLAPMAMGGVMALVWDPRMALFAVFTPVMILGSWAEDRRRGRKERRKTAAALAADLDRFRAALDAARAAAVVRQREARPDPADTVSRAASGDTRLWERRPGADDFLQLRLGTGNVPWRPPTSTEHRRPAEGVAELLEARSVLERAPVEVDLRPGCVLGLVGPRAAAEPLLRSLVVQAATFHGPADVRIGVLTDDDRASNWSWARWLPHTEAGGEAAGLRLLAASDPSDREAVVNALASMDGEHQPARLVVVDADGLTEGRPSPVRSLLAGAAGPVTGIVVTSTTARLPAMCTTIVELTGEDGLARTFAPRTNEAIDSVLVGGMTMAAATAAARSLAGIDDPEVHEAGRSLLAQVGLRSLLGGGVEARWADQARGNGAALAAPIGVTEDGPLVVDLVADGPHGLLAGTTGAGKSELLRTFVVALAANADPEHLNVVLVDYKGGSAFDACARLPHTVGLVTDLDEQLGARALRCLEAELRYRERVLRDAGAADLHSYLRLGRRTPLPRLVVVIDEFATLAAELPDFVDALVGVAQRGRSLGVHLVLATQRPAGAVKDNIRANTNLRIALRVQDAADSTDVIDAPVAAAIGRRQAGRGYARLGPRELVPFQAAYVSGRSDTEAVAPVQLRPLVFGPEAPSPFAHDGGGGPTDLERLVDEITEAAARRGFAPARRPWPDPLPPSLPLSSLPAGSFLLADDLAGQCHRPAGWSPAADGNLLVYGVAGRGTTTAVVSLVQALARSCPPDQLHVYALDFGANGLAPLGQLPHVGAVITAAEVERQHRLLRYLRAELERRRAAPSAGDPTLVLVIDNWSGFAASFDDDFGGLAVRDDIARLVADGPAVGISAVLTADQETAIPLAIANLVPAKLLFHLAPGRAIDTRTGLEVQVALPDLCPIPGKRTAPPIGVLPTECSLSSSVPPAALNSTMDVVVGRGDRTLEAVALVFREADHAIVSGPARSGKTTALRTIAASLARWHPEVAVTTLARRGPSDVASVAELVAVAGRPGPHVLLVDDADAIDDPGGELAALLAAHRPDVHVVAAARADALRSAYGHWTRELRRSRLGLALRPEPDDGDLFSTSFPRRARLAPVPGRGYLVVDGDPEVVQVARP